jgi:hypothetical protein
VERRQKRSFEVAPFAASVPVSLRHRLPAIPLPDGQGTISRPLQPDQQGARTGLNETQLATPVEFCFAKTLTADKNSMPVSNDATCVKTHAHGAMSVKRRRTFTYPANNANLYPRLDNRSLGLKPTTLQAIKNRPLRRHSHQQARRFLAGLGLLETFLRWHLSNGKILRIKM